MDRFRTDLAGGRGPVLSGGPQSQDVSVQKGLKCCVRRCGVCAGHPLMAPSLVFMMWRWKIKNSTATGIVMIAAEASFSGYCVPWLSCPDASCATPFVRVVSSGDCVETMK